MSLVIGFISKDFAMLCGDKRITYDDGTWYDDFQKVFMLNNTIAIGLTGSIHKYANFLFPYLYDDGNTGLQVNYTETENLSFDELTVIFDERFKTCDKSMSMHILVIGLQNDKFVGRLYSSGNNTPEIIPPNPNSNEYNIRILGKEEILHTENFKIIYPQIKSTSKEEKCWKIFNEVLKEGVKYDKSINGQAEGVCLYVE